MILVRQTFQAKYGRGDELVALFKEVHSTLLRELPGRILTDLSGKFFTVVTEYEVESLADWERRTREIWAKPEFGPWFARMMELVEGGQREFYTIEA